MAKKGKKNKKAASGEATLATNRRARHDYKILEEYECGIVLLGTEIKSLREGKISLNDAFATIDDGEVYLRNLHIPEYSMEYSGMCRLRRYTSPSSMVAKASLSEIFPSRKDLISVPSRTMPHSYSSRIL